MRSQIRLILLFLFLLLFPATAFVQGSLASRAPDALTIQDTEFGMAFINSAEELRSTTRIQRGITSGAKLDRFPLYWDKVEPTNGAFNWVPQDAALRANEQQGLGTLAILLGTSPAHWPNNRRMPAQMPRVGDGIRNRLAGVQERSASCDVSGTPPATGLYNAIFTDGSDVPAVGKSVSTSNPWAYYVEQAVKRYQPGGTAGTNVQYWEVWNEPDLCHFWGGTSQEYVRLLKVAYLVIKHVDPDATVMWGGLALFGPKYSGAADFLAEMISGIRNDPLAASHNGFFDVAAIHQYSNVVHGFTYSRQVQRALTGTGWENKAIWVTESGVPICDSYPGPDCPSPYRGNQDEQASYIWQNIAYTRLAGNNAPIFHFQLHDDGGNQCQPSPPADGFGLFTNEPGVQCVPHNAEPRLAYYAYLQATQQFPYTEVLWGDIQDTKFRRVAFYHPESKERRLLVWAIDNRGGTVSVPATSSSARRIALDGSEVTLTPVNGSYQIALSGATSQNQLGESIYTIGGVPYLLIETDTEPPTATMDDLLPVSAPSFQVAWEASDLGSGVQDNSVAIYSSQGDSELWEVWLSNQPANGSATFTGQTGETYRFAVIAEDRAGNRNSTIVELASTVVTDGSENITVSGQVYTMRGAAASWANVKVGETTVQANATGFFSMALPFGQWDVKVEEQTERYGVTLLADTTFSLLLPPVSNPVNNGDFETESPVGVSGWDASGSSIETVEEQLGTSDNALRLSSAFVSDPFVPGSGGSSGGNSTISQQLTVPAGNPYLALYYKVESTETDGGNGSCNNTALLHDKFEIILAKDGDPANYLHCQEVSSDWQWGFFDLSAYAGDQVTLIFNLYESSATNHTSALLDLITIGESPILTAPTPTATATPTMTMTPIVTNTATTTPVVTNTVTTTPIITNTATITATVTSTPTSTQTPTVTQTVIVSQTPTVTSTPTVSQTPTVTPTPTVTSTPTSTPTPTMTVTPTPTATPTGWFVYVPLIMR